MLKQFTLNIFSTFCVVSSIHKFHLDLLFFLLFGIVEEISELLKNIKLKDLEESEKISYLNIYDNGGDIISVVRNHMEMSREFFFCSLNCLICYRRADTKTFEIKKSDDGIFEHITLTNANFDARYFPISRKIFIFKFTCSNSKNHINYSNEKLLISSEESRATG